AQTHLVTVAYHGQGREPLTWHGGSPCSRRSSTDRCLRLVCRAISNTARHSVSHVRRTEPRRQDHRRPRDRRRRQRQGPWYYSPPFTHLPGGVDIALEAVAITREPASVALGPIRAYPGALETPAERRSTGTGTAPC